MTHSHHDTAQGHQSGGGETKFLGAKHRGNDDIAAGFQLPVRLDGDAAAQIIEH